MALTANHLFVDGLPGKFLSLFYVDNGLSDRSLSRSLRPFRILTHIHSILTELMTKMALDEISPFRPDWEERAFRKIYFQLAKAEVTMSVPFLMSQL